MSSLQWRSHPVSVAAMLLAGVFSGCGPSATKSKSDTSDAPSIPVSVVASPPTQIIPAEEMRRRLRANGNATFERSGPHYVKAQLAESGANNLTPLQGQPLKVLDATSTQISDLRPLVGMPLEVLSIVGCPVVDLSPVSGLPLKSLDASNTAVSDLTPLKSLSHLRELYLENAKAKDIAPLTDLTLDKLWLNACPVSDLKPLLNKKFVELNLCGTEVQTLDPLSTMSVQTLWLRDTKVSDLSPLKTQRLVSLDIQGCPVNDLSALQDMDSLERLNISGTQVTDLTPISNLQLTRLIFTPDQISSGIDGIRKMKSLRQLDVSFEGVAPALTPSEFWERYDAGKFKPETAASP